MRYSRYLAGQANARTDTCSDAINYAAYRFAAYAHMLSSRPSSKVTFVLLFVLLTNGPRIVNKQFLITIKSKFYVDSSRPFEGRAIAHYPAQSGVVMLFGERRLEKRRVKTFDLSRLVYELFPDRTHSGRFCSSSQFATCRHVRSEPVSIL